MCQDPVMDCVDQTQRAEGMVTEGRMVFSALPVLLGSRVLGMLCFPKCQSPSAASP